MIERRSPSFGPRRGGVLPDMVVLHYTAMVSAEAALERLCDPEIEVSAHYLISRDGRVYRLVDEAMRAWHAGAGGWGAVTDVNSRSVGIELDNTGAQPFPEPQMAALEALLPGILARWRIAPERVIAHSDMAPERKFDPGGKFDWRRLALRGLAIWPGLSPGPCGAASGENGPQGSDARAFCAAAAQFGYPDLPPEVLLRAFRLRFRPHAEGPLAAKDVAALRALAAAYPVDRAVPGA